MIEDAALPPIQAVPPVIEQDPAVVLDQLAPRIRLLKSEMAKVIVGQEAVILSLIHI